MSSSTWYNSIYLPIALTCVSIVSLTVVLLISPNYFNINSFTSSSSSSSEETPPALLAASNSLLNDASYSDSDNLPEDEASSASLASQVSSDMSNKNTAYTNDNSLPVARSFTIKTSNMAHRESNHPRGKPVKGRASNLQVTGDKRERQHHRHHQVPSSSTSSEEDETDEEDEEKTAANCHRAAVVRCGWMFLRTFKFLDFLPPGEAHPHKCAFRDAFFTCLKTIGDSKCVSIGKYYQPERFRTRLAKTLWKSKDCLLGVNI